jgi:hypothetical protein
MDFLRQISHFEVENKVEELFDLATRDINVYLRIEAGKAGARLLANSGEGLKMPAFIAVLHVASDSGLCWKGRLDMEVREYAGTLAVEMLSKQGNWKALVDKVINGPEIPALVKFKALKVLDPVLAERKAKAAGIYQGHIGFEVDQLPESAEELFLRGEESKYDHDWKVEAGLWFVHANPDDYDWQYGIASGTLDLDDLSDVYLDRELGLDNAELPRDRQHICRYEGCRHRLRGYRN